MRRPIKSTLAVATFSILTLFAFPNAEAEVTTPPTQMAQHLRKGNTSVYFLGVKYCQSARELPSYITECPLFQEEGGQLEFPCYVTAYLQHFHGEDHDGSIIGGIDIALKEANGSSRSPSIKLNAVPTMLAAVKPSLPKDFTPSVVDKMFFRIIPTAKDHVPQKLPVTIIGGFEDERHEFKF